MKPTTPKLRSIFDLTTLEAYEIVANHIGHELPPLDAVENEDWGRDYVLQHFQKHTDDQLAAAGLTWAADEEERRFDYRPRWTAIMLVSLFFGPGAVFMANMAINNDRGLSIYHILHLPPSGATAVYWTIVLLSAGFVACAAVLAVDRLCSNRTITILKTYMVVPSSRWSHDETHIPYVEIVDLQKLNIYGQLFLKIHHANGNYNIAASLLPHKSDFDELCDTITQHVSECLTKTSQYND